MRAKKKTSLKNAPAEDVEEIDDEQVDDDDLEEGKQITPKLVGNFIRMWPRAIFNTPVEASGQRGKRRLIARDIKELDQPGVYILYRDDVPYYVGQAKVKLRSRLRAHANSVGSLRSYFWNYFSAFLVKDPSHIEEVEAILIAAMPSVITNGAKPKLPRIKMDAPTRKVMRELRANGHY
jgi:hypothetical protein